MDLGVTGSPSRARTSADAHDHDVHRDPSAPPWRSSTAVTIGAVAILVAVTVIDILISEQVVVLTLFLGLSPLLASAVLTTRSTMLFAAAALALAFLAGLWNPDQGAQYWVRVLNVACLGALSVFVAEVRTRREAELRTSQKIATAAQEALLPVIPRRLGNLEVATRYHSATREAQIGGDFFDFVADRGRTRLILGDVSGKGVDAVGQAARVIRAFRQYGASEDNLLDVARRVDEYVQPFWSWEYFATAVLIEVTDGDTLTVVSAGHPPPLHLSADGVSEMPVAPGGPPLGLGPASRSTQHTWAPSDRLLLYTDGLIEARSSSGEFLPELTIQAAMREPGLDESLDRLLDAVDRHADGFKDDLALLIMANRGAESA